MHSRFNSCPIEFHVCKGFRSVLPVVCQGVVALASNNTNQPRRRFCAEFCCKQRKTLPTLGLSDDSERRVLIGGVDGDTLSPDGSGDNESGLLFPCGVRLTIEHEAKQVRFLPDLLCVTTRKDEC